MKEKQGISLVALIITIIVLIILTGAVIITMNQGNTIGKSEEAVFKSDLTNFRDQLVMKILDKQAKMEITGKGDAILNNVTGNNLRTWVPSITDKYIGKLAIKEGNLYYTDTTNEQEFGWAAEIDMIDISSTLAGNPGLKVGDYIKYTPGAGSYTATSAKTGYGTQRYLDLTRETPANSDQTFTSTATEETWRVLSIDGANVTIVRGEPIGGSETLWGETGLILFGEAGYNNAIEELNNICKIYKNGTQAKEARSITIEDINKVTNYTQAEMNSFRGGSSNEGGYGYVSPEIYGRTYTSDYYEYLGTRNGKMINTSNEYTMIFKNNANNSDINYWAASCGVYAFFDYTSFCVGVVDNGYVRFFALAGNYGIENNFVFGVRPVVILKSTVKLSNEAGQDGSSSNPWKLQ